MNLYKQQFPDRTFDEGVIDFLRLSPTEFGNVQGVAKQWLGQSHFHHAISRKPPKKLLPSALEKISTHNQSTLAALMHLEKKHHDDHEREYHMGGGLWETGTSILNDLWNITGFGPEFNSLLETVGFKKKNTKLTKDEMEYALVVEQAYNKPGERQSIDDWTLRSDYSTDKFVVYEDPFDKIVHVGIRGTKANVSDVISDLNILAGNTSGHEAELEKELRDVLLHYHNPGSGHEWHFDVSSHSLGALEAMNIFENTDDPVLKRVSEVNLFNPGLSPIHNLDTAREAASNDKFHWYLNSGDLISNTAASVINDDTYVRWGDTTHNPLENHSLEQWTDEGEEI